MNLEELEKSRDNLFITGPAGTGKSTLLNNFRSKTSRNVVVLAPTGIAAINVDGQTIHSFFNFGIDITPEKAYEAGRKSRSEIYESIDVLIIDEISMVRADLFDCMDSFLRGRLATSDPFGGIQIILFGDLYQLPPVVTSQESEIFRSHYPSPYFFSSHVFENIKMKIVYLEKIFRQADPRFIQILNNIRSNEVDQFDLDELNEHGERNLTRLIDDKSDFPNIIYLTTTNQLVDRINEQKLKELDANPYVYDAKLSGNFDRRYYPVSDKMELKLGAQVMILHNDVFKRYVNGTLGIIEKIDEDREMGDTLHIRTEGGEIVDVEPYKWKLSQYRYDAVNQKIVSEEIGSFTQYPVKIAWAITIHKSQGKSFDNLYIDLGSGSFAHGQTYVALSRCRSLNGLVLKRPIRREDIKVDPVIVQFMKQIQES